jgi:hypothetical protein
MNRYNTLTCLVDKVRCWFGRHIYVPAYEVRQLNTLKGRYLHKEFRYKCECCKRHTRWYRWRHLDKFAAKHKPDWANCRLSLEQA